MVTTRDIEKVLSLLRQLYEFVIIDTRAALSDDVLVFLDSADLILQVLTYDSMAIRSLAMSAETFAAIGYPPSKLATVLNRSDASGGFDKADVEQALGANDRLRGRVRRAPRPVSRTTRASRSSPPARTRRSRRACAASPTRSPPTSASASPALVKR